MLQLLLKKAGVTLEEILPSLSYTVHQHLPIKDKQCAQVHMLLLTPNLTHTMCWAPC